MQTIFREVKNTLIFEYRNNLDFPAHIHEDIELVYVVNGGCEAYCDGNKYTLANRDFFTVFPNQVHHYCNTQPGRYILLIIKPKDLLSYNSVFTGKSPASSVVRPFTAEDNAIENLLNTALNEHLQKEDITVIYAYLTALIGKLLKYYEIQDHAADCDTVTEIINFCSAHYKDSITLKDIAENLHISTSTVSHIFSKKLYINFCDYINSLRLSDAVDLLYSTNLPVTEIAYTTGFSTLRTFNRAFLRRYGVSPSSYRKQNRIAK